VGAKDNAAVIHLLDLLESRVAMRVIWALCDGHPQTFRLLQDSVGGVTPNSLNTRLNELRAARLVDHAGSGYCLTSAGANLARRMHDTTCKSSRSSGPTSRRGPCRRRPPALPRTRPDPLHQSSRPNEAGAPPRGQHLWGHATRSSAPSADIESRPSVAGPMSTDWTCPCPPTPPFFSYPTALDLLSPALEPSSTAPRC